jgi:pyrophosphatase PpaX
MASIGRVRYPVVLFDLDGTLIDSGAMIVASMRHAATTVLGREVPEEQLRGAVGGPGLVAQMRALDETRVDELVDAYRRHNEPLHESLEPCAGIERALEALRDDGRRLGIVTAKRHATVRLAFKVLPQLEAFFDVVVAADDTERHKPHPDPLLLALDRLGASPEETAYVGDSPFDVQAAKAARVGAIAVTWGGIHDSARLEREQPDALVSSPEELVAAV